MAETIKEAVAVEAAAEKEMTIVLNTEFTTNGAKYGPGKVTVPELVAEDLLRRQEEYDKVEKFRLQGGDFTVKEALASFDAAGK